MTRPPPAGSRSSRSRSNGRLEERVKALEYLAEVDRKAPPWDGKWWGTQPAKQKPPARTIAWDGTPRIAATLRELAKGDSSPRIRTTAVEALADSGNDDSRSFLRGLFPRETDPGVKRAIALALGKLADADAVDLLTATLRDTNSPETVRDAAFEAVEMIGSKKAVGALIDLLGQKTLNVEKRPNVIRALGVQGRRGDQAAGAGDETLNGGRAIGGGRCSGRRSSRRRSQPPREDVATGIRSLLTDPASEVRRRAIDAAAAIGDRQAVPALIELADKPDAGFDAALALAELPDIRALAGLSAWIDHKKQRAA